LHDPLLFAAFPKRAAFALAIGLLALGNSMAIDMAKNPEIALLVSTYQRPRHLRRALLSIALQKGVDGQMEVIVTDDGSRDETPQVVRDFARTVDFPVEFTTHPHSTFQLARCRNEGVAASRAPYLLFLDGDCVLPPDHVAIHLAQRRPGVVMAGHFMRIDETNSAKIDEAAIRHGNFSQWISESEKQFVRRLDLKWRFHQWLRHPTKPKLFGNNIGIWRRDYERVNGYDETFEGWGCEDDDLRLRLRRAGVRIESILRWTNTFHLWHPSEPTQPREWKQGRNVAYLQRKGVLVCCRNGLVKRNVEDIRLRVMGSPPPPTLTRLILAHSASDVYEAAPEIEVVFHPGSGKFSGKAECNVLVALDDSPLPRHLARRAHIVVSDDDLPVAPFQRTLRLSELEDALQAAA
jgi:glycosyltransferase involved in cell wall biosynthesis